MEHTTSHILVVTFPAQGHINPCLQFAKHLVQNGARVTFVTSLSAGRRMSKLPNSEGLSVSLFSDGYDDGFNFKGDGEEDYAINMKQGGSEALRNLISSSAEARLCPVIYITHFLHPTTQKETKPRVLVNTFNAIEPEALKAIRNYHFTAIGPLVPSAYLDGRDPSDNSFGGDLFRGTSDYKGWLDSQAEGSVVYVSFGSIAEISKRQTKEVADGLLASGRPFIWVMRVHEETTEEISCKDELAKQGMIVPWCSQLEVLSHPSLGCFVTHCGWNSTLESLVWVPVVTFPQWSDQTMNAKLVEYAWGTGVRVEASRDGTVEAGEIKRCLDVVLGNRREEMKGNALKWKKLAREAVNEGGSSYLNLKDFIDDVSGRSSQSHT